MRRRQNAFQESSDDESDGGDRSYVSSRSNTSINSPSFRGRNDSGSDLLDSSTIHSSSHSESLNDSVNRSSSNVYPDLSKEMNNSGDSSSTRSGTEWRMNELSRGRSSSPKKKELRSRSHTPLPRQRSDSKSSDGVGGGGGGNFLIYGVVFLVILILGIFLAYKVSSSSDVSTITKSGYDWFEEEVEFMTKSFPSQTLRFWTTVSASARHVFEQRDPCYPSVILIVAHNKNKRLNTCLAKKIANTFSSSQGVNSKDYEIGTDVETFKHLKAEEQKLFLDKALQAAFQKDKIKAFVISNVHLLSPKAALLLHGFCDGDNAPYKDVMILLTFQVDDETDFHSVKQVEGFLTNIWSKGLDMDKLTAVMSRIANNPLMLKSEEESVVNKMCS